VVKKQLKKQIKKMEQEEEKQKEYKHKSILFLSHTKIIKEYELISIEHDEDDDILITTLKI
jgi:hypothetical protein